MTDALPVPAWFNPKEILARVIEGKSTKEIAASLSVSKEQLVYFLRTRATEDWKEAQIIRQLRRYEEAEEEMDASLDMFALRKAETKLKSSQWLLERLYRRIYGDEAPKGEGSELVINIHIDRTQRGNVIEHEPTALIAAK